MDLKGTAALARVALGQSFSVGTGSARNSGAGRIDGMTESKFQRNILIVDDEWNSTIVRSVRNRLDEEGWRTRVIVPFDFVVTGDDFEAEALYAIEEEAPDGVVLDVRFGESKDDRFKGLAILQKIVHRHPHLPVLMFTQYVQGPDRETAVRGTLKWDAQVDFIDKLASPEEVVMRLRRMIGITPDNIRLGSKITMDTANQVVYAHTESGTAPVTEIQGIRFEILQELATTWYRSPGELVPFSRLMRYMEGEDPRASIRVRIREIKVAIGKAIGIRFGAGDLIINIRDRGYRLVPPD